MIYRYRLISTTYAAKGMIEAPRLAALDLTVPEEFEQLGEQTQALQTASASVTAEPATANTDTASSTAAPAPEAATPQMTTVENTLNTVAGQTPVFVSRYRNLNLLMVGLQMTSSLPQQVADLKQSFANLKTLKDPQARATAVSDFSTKLQGVIAFMSTNFNSPLVAHTK
jgi:hypothetical protein